jgi:uncharacterized protein
MKKNKRQNQTAEADSLDAIYAAIPEVHCQGLCQQSCGPIGLFQVEVERLSLHLHTLPTASPSLTCSKLSRQGRCTIYSDRPIICRLFGASQKLRCPWGCVPDRWLSDQEAHALFARIKALKSGKSYISPIADEPTTGDS